MDLHLFLTPARASRNRDPIPPTMEMIMRHFRPKIPTLGRTLAGLCLLAAASLPGTAAQAQQPPAFLFEPMLDIYFDDRSGLIAFHGSGFDLAFPPDEPLRAVIAVVDDSNTVVQSFPLRQHYQNRTGNGVIARTAMDGTAEITLTEPGVYNIVFMIDGQPVSRLPVALERVEVGDDPFDHDTVYSYFGLWQRYAHITQDTWKGEDWPLLTFWAGLRDFDEPGHQLPFLVEMRRDGELVAHSKRTQGSIPHKHYQRVKAHLYHPHERRSAANAKPFLATEWARDGDYEIRVLRSSDGQVLRRFNYTAQGGEIQPLPETLPGHAPAIDYRPARVREKGSTGYDFIEAIWIRPHD